MPYSPQMKSLYELVATLGSIDSDIDKFFEIGYVEYQERASEQLSKLIALVEELRPHVSEEIVMYLDRLAVILLRSREKITFLTTLEDKPENSREITKQSLVSIIY